MHLHINITICYKWGQVGGQLVNKKYLLKGSCNKKSAYCRPDNRAASAAKTFARNVTICYLQMLLPKILQFATISFFKKNLKKLYSLFPCYKHLIEMLKYFFSKRLSQNVQIWHTMFPSVHINAVQRAMLIQFILNWNEIG